MVSRKIIFTAKNTEIGDFMSLIKITDLTNQFGISSRSLRYYEQVGLIQSVRPEFEKYRYFDDENVERLKQIMVLRKMQITIKDILRIYESEDMSVVVETFVERINAIDDEIGALSKMKLITNEFLQTMIKNGIKKISALPLLYDEMEKELAVVEEHKPVSYRELEAASEKLAKPIEYSITDLPKMRVLTSFRKPDTSQSDYAGFLRYVQMNGLSAASGSHRQFEFQTEAGDVLMVRVPEDFVNDSEYLDYTFDGGLFAAVNIYLDGDLSECLRALLRELDANPYYQFAYCSDGTSRHPTLLENLISPDDKRELVSMLVPVKKRLADPSLFDKPVEITDITIEEIEAANPLLWTVDVPLDKLTPIHDPHYKMTEDGELEFIGWINTRVMNTNVAVKLPFRVDIEFRTGEHSGFGANDGSVRIYHGHHGLDHNYGFGINMGDNTATQRVNEAINFNQPVFRDRFNFPQRGKILLGEYNRLTWIIGKKHLACIINGEVRYCGTKFPYMSLDLSREEAQPIVFGSEQKKYFRSVRVSQLVQTPKNKLKKEELTMITKQSNNMIPVIHRLVTNEYGENYWFNGCAKYVMECLGEPDYNYWFFAGLTGDIFTQHYNSIKYAGDALTSYMTEENMGGKPTEYIEEVFAKCGYAATYVPIKDLRKNTEMYLNTLIAYIDKGVPVIAWGAQVGVYVGYEDYGKVLLLITGNSNQPERIPFETVLEGWTNTNRVLQGDGGWIFVGEKKESIPLADIYRKAILDIPKHLNAKNHKCCFGAEAFRAWAKDIENGKFDGMAVEDFDTWAYHTNYICVLATNGSCCYGYLDKAKELNPDFTFIDEIKEQYRRTNQICSGDNGNDLEALGSGFNVTLEVLQDKEKRAKIAAKIRECAECIDNVVDIIESNTSK
ncbi:MAG: MerR family transcriptional regulator [Christensenellales bacterium]|jgi:DNA-binding transcriptional MerR regulator